KPLSTPTAWSGCRTRGSWRPDSTPTPTATRTPTATPSGRPVRHRACQGVGSGSTVRTTRRWAPPQFEILHAQPVDDAVGDRGEMRSGETSIPKRIFRVDHQRPRMYLSAIGVPIPVNLS